MNTLPSFILVLATCFFMVGCQRPLTIDDDQPTNTEADWKTVNFQSERLVQKLFATGDELYVLSENQFCRFNTGNELIEERPLDATFGARGIPAMSQYTFVRMTNDSETRQIVEFHLCKNPGPVVSFLADDLAGPADNFLEVEFLARTLGAFNEDGTLFLLPTRVFPSRKYAFFLFQINQNQSHSEFNSVNIINRIDLNGLSADFANLSNLRFLNGNFYLTAREGAWRITPQGEVTQISAQWMRDAFFFNNKLYITGFSNTDLSVSNDNGLTWQKVEPTSGLRMVEVTGGMLLTQEVLGIPYQLERPDFSKAQEIIYPAGVPYDPLIYYGTAYFQGHYYFSIDKKIYFTKQIAVK